jgi:hypothetical protein
MTRNGKVNPDPNAFRRPPASSVQTVRGSLGSRLRT